MADRVEYRYFTTDLLTNAVLSEIPFRNVSWGRAVRRAGEFSGEIPVIAETEHLNLYESTMPGKTGLYVLRDGVCVWGGIIWSRDYDPKERTLQVSASEFVSYLYHRFVWKTLLENVIGTRVDPIQIGAFSVTSGVATITTRPIDLGVGSIARAHGLSIGDQIIVANMPLNGAGLEGGQVVSDVLSPSQFQFEVDTPDVAGFTTASTFRKSIQNALFVRDIISRVCDDFAGLSVTRDIFHPGQMSTFSVISRSRKNGTATIVVDGDHGLIEGQEVVIQDVARASLGGYDGRYTVSGIPSSNTFEYPNDGNDEVVTDEDGIRTLAITGFSVSGGTVTLTTNVAHQAAVGDELIVDVGRPKSRTTEANPDIDLFDETVKVSTVFPATPTKLQYQRAGDAKTFWYFQRNITKQGCAYNAVSGTWTVTLEVDQQHNYISGANVKVTGLSLPFDGPYEITNLPSNVQIQYNVERSVGIKKRVSKGGQIIFTTKEAHGFKAGDAVEVSGYGTPDRSEDGTGGYNSVGTYPNDDTVSPNGTWIIENATTYTVVLRKRFSESASGSYAKDNDTITLTNANPNVRVGMSVSGEGIPSNAKVKAVSNSGKTITLDRKTEKKVAPVSTKATGSNNSNVITVVDAASIFAGMRVFATGIPSGTLVKDVNRNTKKVTLTNDLTAALSADNVLFRPIIEFQYDYPEKNGVDDSPPNQALIKCVSDIPFGSVNKSNDEMITQTDRVNVVAGGSVVLGPRAYAGTYGGFAANADIGLSVVEETEAGAYRPQQNYIGSNLQSVGEILENISAGTDGFEYRIDCNYDENSGTFSRTLVLNGYDIPDTEPGIPRTLQSLGADRFVFDYPGSVETFRIEESAEEAATRMWVTGSTEGMSGEGKQYMAAASNVSMLREGWPIIDASESLNENATTPELYAQAKSFLNESLPPIDNLTVTVNGSIPPYVGTYKPGDWCSLVIDDAFMKMRLASDQEVRDNIFVRKILEYRVTVPDAIGIPESVSLELIRDTEVDNDGNQ